MERRKTRPGAPTSTEPPVARHRGLVRLDTIKHRAWEQIRGQLRAWLGDGTEVFVQSIFIRTAVLCAEDGVRSLVKRDTLWVDPQSIVVFRNARGDAGERGRENAKRLRREKGKGK